jgi:hypothetical protein
MVVIIYTTRINIKKISGQRSDVVDYLLIMFGISSYYFIGEYLLRRPSVTLVHLCQNTCILSGLQQSVYTQPSVRHVSLGFFI